MTVQTVRTVLVVDDDPSVLKLLQHILAQAGYLALAAADGREAISLYEAQAGAIDLLITDLLMPGLGGKDLAGQLRQKRPNLPVVFISGDAEGGSLPSLAEFPRCLFFHKPFLPSELLARLPEILQ